MSRQRTDGHIHCSEIIGDRWCVCVSVCVLLPGHADLRDVVVHVIEGVVHAQEARAAVRVALLSPKLVRRADVRVLHPRFVHIHGELGHPGRLQDRTV